MEQPALDVLEAAVRQHRLSATQIVQLKSLASAATVTSPKVKPAPKPAPAPAAAPKSPVPAAGAAKVGQKRGPGRPRKEEAGPAAKKAAPSKPEPAAKKAAPSKKAAAPKAAAAPAALSRPRREPQAVKAFVAGAAPPPRVAHAAARSGKSLV
jgi:hypothetical protein